MLYVKRFAVIVDDCVGLIHELIDFIYTVFVTVVTKENLLLA